MNSNSEYLEIVINSLVTAAPLSLLTVLKSGGSFFGKRLCNLSIGVICQKVCKANLVNIIGGISQDLNTVTTQSTI